MKSTHLVGLACEVLKSNAFVEEASALLAVNKQIASMAKKKRSSRQRRSRKDLSKDLWISPHLSLRGRDGDRGWNRSGNLTPGTGARFLELADIALGTKKTGQKKKKPQER